MSSKVFKYSHYHFMPVGVFPKGSSLAENIRTVRISDDLHLSKESNNYSWEGFYKASGNSDADVFLCLETAKCYVPASNYLFEFRGELSVLNEKL